MREIKVWGGTHPNEMIGMLVADDLIANPLPNVHAGIANPLARSLGNMRFVDINMAFAYPGDKNSAQYEERRAIEVRRQSRGYDTVFDLHANNYEGIDTAYIGSGGVSPDVLGFLAGIGLRQLILEKNHNMYKYVKNCVLLEVVVGGPRDSVAYWRRMFEHFVKDEFALRARPQDFQWYEMVHDLTIDEVRPDELKGTEKPFDRIGTDFEQRIGSTVPLHWVVLDRKPTDMYLAELASPIDAPDASGWHDWQ